MRADGVAETVAIVKSPKSECASELPWDYNVVPHSDNHAPVPLVLDTKAARARSRNPDPAPHVICGQRPAPGTAQLNSLVELNAGALNRFASRRSVRRRAPWPSGRGGDVRIFPVLFLISLHFRPLMIGLNVPVSAECEPDKSNRQQDGASYDQPMRISDLSTSLRSFSLLEYLRTTFRAVPAARGPPGDYDCSFLIVCSLADLLKANSSALLHCIPGGD